MMKNLHTVLMGLIAGDALGVPVQFMEKEEIVTREVGERSMH